MVLSVPEGGTRIQNKGFYKGKVCVSVIGFWRNCFSRPLWVLTNLMPNSNDSIEINMNICYT